MISRSGEEETNFATSEDAEQTKDDISAEDEEEFDDFDVFRKGEDGNWYYYVDDKIATNVNSYIWHSKWRECLVVYKGR